MSVKVQRKFNGSRGGAIVSIVEEVDLDEDEKDAVETSEFLEASQCRELAVELLRGHLTPNTFGIVEDLIRHNPEKGTK